MAFSALLVVWVSCSDETGATPEPDALPCAPACLDSATLQVCDESSASGPAGGEALVIPCPLGCDESRVACQALVPSNGASVDHLAGVDAGLVVPDGALATLDSDTGALVVDGTFVRTHGVGLLMDIALEPLTSGPSVYAVSHVHIGADARLRVSGSRALILLSAGDVDIEGVIDVSAGCDGGDSYCAGPGGGEGAREDTDQADGCAPGESGGFLGTGSGGGGGGLGSDGADGGGRNSQNGAPGGIVLEESCAGASLVPMMGGSGGGSGDRNYAYGSGGGGGGAIQISSFTRVRIATTGAAPAGIDAGGAGGGGLGSSTYSGGGGGGSGGAILLEAPSVTLVEAVLAANGGGGGSAGNGNDGSDGVFGLLPAPGGASSEPLAWGPGGAGGARNVAASAGFPGDYAGGGGGGGVGIIRLTSAEADIDPLTIISPAPTQALPEAM